MTYNLFSHDINYLFLIEIGTLQIIFHLLRTFIELLFSLIITFHPLISYTCFVVFLILKNPIFNIIEEKKNLSKNWIKNPNRFAEEHHYERNSRAICRHQELPISLSVIAGLPTGRTKQRKWNGSLPIPEINRSHQLPSQTTFIRKSSKSRFHELSSILRNLLDFPSSTSYDVFERVLFEIRRCTKHADLSLFRALDNGRPGIIGRRATKAWLTMQNRGLIR